MTAEQLSKVLHGKKSRKGHWLALCPAHQDRHPSLSIAEGRKGILLKCLSNGCDIKEILYALGLQWSDLFYNSPLDRQALKQIHLEELRKDRQRKQRKEIRNLAIKRAYDWDDFSARLGERLARDPENEKLAAKFHYSLSMMRKCESIAHSFWPYASPRTWGNGLLFGIHTNRSKHAARL